MTTPPAKKNPLGPTGETVAANIKRLRTKHGLTYVELAEKLEAVGRSIPTLGLRKIESEDRRVDADDLVALAVVLGVNPNALLLPPTDYPEHVVTITGGGMRPAVDVWRWGRGDAPLVYDNIPESVPSENRIGYARAHFENYASPSVQDWTKAPHISVVEWSGDGNDQ